jgi:hypothetical protein
MRQTKIVIGVEHPQLVPHAVLSLTQRGDPTPYGRHTLPDVQVEPFDKGCLDLPTTCRQPQSRHGSGRDSNTTVTGWASVADHRRSCIVDLV